MWLGLVIGIVVGGLAGEWAGAILGGFVGWLIGLIIASWNKKTEPQVVTARTAPADSLAVRLERLERRYAALEARLARIETGAEISAPEDVIPAEAGTQPDAIPAQAGTQLGDVVPTRTGPPTLGPGLRRGDEQLRRGDEATAVEPPASRPPPAPAVPREPAKPNPIVAWFTGPNAIARIGLAILFIGLAFLLKYAADRDFIPIELRVAGVAAAGVAMLVGGWRLRTKRAGYALGMQGAGVGVLYLTTFAAFRLYHLLPGELAFVLLAAIAVLSAFIAIAQDAPILAAFGAGGGFLAPILASTGGGSHVALFSYYLLLNAGILVVALFKAWRGLNVMGFLFTFVIGLAWGMKFYKPEYFATTEPFLVAFFLLYVAVAVLFARQQAPQLKHYVDGTIVFGVPLAAFGLQVAMVREMEYGMALSALALGAFYVVLASALYRSRGASWKLLVEAFLALGIVFATLAIPLALDARWTSAAWALEGAAIYWYGIRQERKLARAFGLLLQLGSAASYGISFIDVAPVAPSAESRFLGGVLLAVAAVWTARLIRRNGPKVTVFEREIEYVALVWGVLWWLFAACVEIDQRVGSPDQLVALVLVLAATALAFSAMSVRLDWPAASIPGRCLLPLLVVCLVLMMDVRDHPFAGHGWLAWAAAIAAQVWILWLLGPRVRGGDGRAKGWLHAGTALFIAAIGAVELNWLAARYTAHDTAWSIAAAMVVPALVAIGVSHRASDERWPIAARPRAYRVAALGTLLVALGIWSLIANFTHDGTSDPLPYLPIVNALDLGHVLAVITLAMAWLGHRRRPDEFLKMGQGTATAVGALAFIWLNGVLLRSIHHWAGIDYDFREMSNSVLVQSALSIFWTVLALTLMVFATRKKLRPIWILGAALMGVVVVKLFIVDLEHVGGIERIVSFIGVGLLMLVVGYFAPVPPRRVEAKA
jgi:uncharacterized membrane protein